ncbi:shikimate dehydrogenase [Streptomyces sp. HB132]|uniref:shikimate dehydrogenase family protein n=1 Tax=Streptomyces sp. HB132 TaxID=767388 RepID=UPI0019605C94|nr:NAD(P)-binding domain-containing protein [Streptomyces sp. HB132]MBM7440062.1 shikimate dehydrogenase [Streptomyces sp. HB132]
MEPAVPGVSAPQISGSTRLYAVLGAPVEQVRAPSLLNPLFARLGIDAVLFPVHVDPDAFAGVVHGLTRMKNLDGLLVTIPHKAAALRLADEVSPAAAAAGAVNALRREPDGRWRGENFDGTGFVRGLTGAGHLPEGKRIVVMGAGGAGSAIAAALLAAGAAQLTVCDPDAAKLRDLVARLEEHWPGRATGEADPALGNADIMVNATPLGMRADDPQPFPVRALAPRCVVADVIMKPSETALLKAAAAHGHPILHGAHMLDHQLDLYRTFFRLDEPPRR